jgi:hypothetical protein
VTISKLGDNKMKTILEYAKFYAKKGLHVFPVYWITDEGICSCKKGSECTSPGKHPITKNGYKDATTDDYTISLKNAPKYIQKFIKENNVNVGYKNKTVII